MRLLYLLLLATTAVAQGPRVQISNTTENLRGVSAVSRQVAWASGTHGTYLRTVDGGRTWTPAQVPDAGGAGFSWGSGLFGGRSLSDVVGSRRAVPDLSHQDGGQHWQLQFTNKIPKGFFDAIAFWDAKHGVVLGDPVADESGKLKFELLQTEDGQNWRLLAPAAMPEALEGEGAFAASNSCLAILRESGDRICGSPLAGRRHECSIQGIEGRAGKFSIRRLIHGEDSTGIFSIAFRDALHGVIAGGDYKKPNDDGPNLAFTDDGGKTWTLAHHPQAYFSAVAFDQRVNWRLLGT